MSTQVPRHPQVVGQKTLSLPNLVRLYMQEHYAEGDVIAIYHPTIHALKLIRLGILREVYEANLDQVLLVTLPSPAIARDWMYWLENEKEADDPRESDLYAEWYHQGEFMEENT